MGAELAIRPFKSEGISEPDRAKRYDEDLHERFICWKEQNGISLRKLAPMLRWSYTSLGQYINYKYEGDLQVLEKDIRILLRRKEDPDLTRADEFLKISTSLIILEVLQFCHEKGQMGAIIGPSGVSKTRTAKQYQKKKKEVVLITADPTKKNLSSILKAIANRVGSAIGTSSYEILNSIIEKLRNTDRLLIIDEAHFLQWEAFETVRTIYDQTGIGICYLGMPKLFVQMKGRKGYLWDQILSRISINRSISRIEKEDVKLIADSIHPGLPKNCVSYLHEIAGKPGKLRVVVELLKQAVDVHKTEKIPITLNLLKEINELMTI